MGEREGGRGNGKETGRSSSLAGNTLESLPRETKGDVISSVSLGTHTEEATMVMLASYECSQHCAGILTLHLL